MTTDHDPAANERTAEAHNQPDLVRDARARDAALRVDGRGWSAVFRRRLAIAALFVGCWAVGIQTRLVYLQVVAHDELLQRAERQWSRTREVPPKRGDLVDRNGDVLAYSVDGHAVYAEPPLVVDADATARAVCKAIEECSPRDIPALTDRLRRNKAFQYLWRRASPEDAARVKALRSPGIGVLTEQRRYYPNRELAAHVLGFASLDNLGLGGIESTYNSRISGHPGRVLLQTDAKAQPFGRVERPPTAGATLELTIDRELQHIAERELEAGVREFGAAGGSVVVLEPRTGDVLALANWPTFNPNRFQDADARHTRNRAVQEVYEPGSTFKVVTASAALEHKLATVDEAFDVSAGHIRFGSRRIDDVHNYGTLSFSQILVKSSNVGAIKIGLRVGADRMVDYVRRFGFGDAIARDLPGQTRGIVWKASDLSDSALASVSMGYQVGVTPIQMAAAVNVIANGGELMEPRVVRAIIEGNRRTERAPRMVRRAIEEKTALQLTSIMEAVVAEGTATAARIDGYTVAGKTGTAAKLENGRYSKSNYNASFVGFAPSRNPAVTVLVVIDSPHGKGYYGGSVAAPIFKRVTEAALRHLGVPPNVNTGGRVLVARAESSAADEVTATLTGATRVPRPSLIAAAGVMPDLRGVSARAAVRTLAELGVVARLVGDGLVTDQQILPGAPLERGVSCLLRLSRLAPAVAASQP